MFNGGNGQHARLQPGGSTFDEQVVGLRTATGKNDFRRMRARSVRHALPRLIDRSPRRPPILMTTRGIAILFAQEGQHGLQHHRPERRRRIVV